MPERLPERRTMAARSDPRRPGATERPARPAGPAIRVKPEDLPPRKPRSRRAALMNRRLDPRVEPHPLEPDER